MPNKNLKFENEIFNVEQNSAILHISKEVYLRIIKKAITQTRADIILLETACDKNDGTQVLSILHRWKGDYNNLHILSLATMAGTLADLFKSQSDIILFKNILEEFKSHFKQIEHYLTN